MAERVGISEWRRLYRTLTAERPVAYDPYHPGADAVKAAAKRFESESGYTLPRSYKAFAQVFGPGELGGYYRICIPGDEKCGCDLATEHAMVRETRGPPDSYEQGELLSRLLYFATTIGGEFVGWDPHDVTDSTGPEYRVYYITRTPNAKAVAGSFSEFVSEICLKNRLHEIFGWQNNNEPDWPPQEFLPYAASGADSGGGRAEPCVAADPALKAGRGS